MEEELKENLQNEEEKTEAIPQETEVVSNEEEKKDLLDQSHLI